MLDIVDGQLQWRYADIDLFF